MSLPVPEPGNPVPDKTGTRGKLRLAVVSPFLDKRHGTERCIAEQLERLAGAYEIHLYSERVGEDVDLSNITWHPCFHPARARISCVTFGGLPPIISAAGSTGIFAASPRALFTLRVSIVSMRMSSASTLFLPNLRDQKRESLRFSGTPGRLGRCLCIAACIIGCAISGAPRVREFRDKSHCAAVSERTARRPFTGLRLQQKYRVVYNGIDVKV